MIIEQPDYAVVRVSLVEMKEHTFNRLLAAVGNTDDLSIWKHSKATIAKAKERWNAKTKDEEHKYINVAGGLGRAQR